tara:strand:+ start:38 stop:694 length:657 start_codon:yes stop_codon:yes gene_type:complete
MSNYIKINNLDKTFSQGDRKIEIFNNFNLEVEMGEFVSITGPSGSGKTTLLQIIAMIDNFDNGSYNLLGQDISDYSNVEKCNMRLQNFGFIYQSFNLLEDFNALENVAMPLIIRGVEKSESYKLASNMLKNFNLDHREGHYSNELSGGEQQRVAIARAAITKPKIIIADEPTGNLDKENSTQVLDFLFKSIEKDKITLIMATHNEEIASRAAKRVNLE